MGKNGIKIFRYSGKPLTVEDLQAHKADFQAGYDKILQEHGPDMLKVHEELQKLDTELAQKWKLVDSVPLPKSAKAWKAMANTYQAPVLVAQSSENPAEIVLVVMDEPLA